MDARKFEESNITCRACMADFSENIGVYNLYDDFDQGLSLSDILIDTGFECSIEDGFSNLFCCTCTDIVVNFYNFKRIFLSNQECLRLALEVEEQNKSQRRVEETVSRDIANKNISTIKYEQEDGIVINDCNKCLYVTLDVENEFNDNETVLGGIHNKENVHTTKYEELEDSNIISDCNKDSRLDSEELIRIITEDCNIPDEPTKLPKKEKRKVGIKTTKSLVKESKRYIRIPNVIVEKDGNWQCKECNQEYKDYQTIREHIKVHKKFVCEQCGSRFMKKCYLDDHAEKHSSEKKYVCPICEKAFKRRTVFVKHRRIHTHPGHYVCELCGDRFNTVGTLSTHRYLKHNGERKYECKICNQKFPLKATLQKHIYRHQERSNTYFCTTCQMGYKDKSSLNRHILDKHFDKEKPRCEVCRRHYSSKAALNRHMRKHLKNSVIK